MSNKIVSKSIAAVIVISIFVLALSSCIFEDNKIAGIKNSYFEDYSTEATIGEALEGFCEDTEWEIFTEGNKEYVKFSGEGMLWGYGNRASLIIVVFEIERDWFWVNSMSVNGKELNDVEISNTLYEIFTRYDEK
ncbi:MAG: hypothetical protein E7649_03865 [Ruminococcaceae bacterium]|nr:hypothetical protein [Oscillospiraceae bacterium]